MCRQTTCRTCGKVSWAGCGQHVEQVMRGIPNRDRCSCPPPERRPGLLQRIFGR